MSNARLRTGTGLYQIATAECALCRQLISADRQMPFAMIVKLRYAMCPSCRQPVPTEIKDKYSYRTRWVRFIRRTASRWKAGKIDLHGREKSFVRLVERDPL